MRTIFALLILFAANVWTQTLPTPLAVNRIYGITSASQVIDNRSVTSETNFNTFIVYGSGTWSVTMQYSDVSKTGPWTAFGSQGSLTNASSSNTGYGVGYHAWISFAITGTVSINYAAVRDFYPGTGGSAGFIPSITAILKGNGAGGAVAATPPDVASLLQPQTGCATPGYAYSPATDTCIGASSIGSGSTLPSTCTVGTLFDLTSAYPQHAIYACTSTNVYTLINPYEVQVSVTEFGAVCNGVADDTAALTAFVTYLNANPLAAGYIPAGKCMMNGELRLTGTNFIHGDGAQASFLVETNTTSDLLVEAWNGSGALTNPFYEVLPTLEGIGLSGQGLLTTGNLLIVHTNTGMRLLNMAYMGTAGRALQIQSERTFVTGMEIDDVRQGVAFIDTSAINESYLRDFLIDRTGWAQDDLGTSGSTATYCYSINCVGGVFPSGSGTFVQDPHAAIETGSNADNIEIGPGSIKPTTYQGGIRLRACSVCSLDHIYIEGYNANSVNPSLTYGGLNEATTLSNTINTAQLVFDVPFGGWFRPFASNILDITGNQGPSFYVIRPPDYVQGSSVASSIGGGILKGNFEIVAYQGILHDSIGSGWHVELAARSQQSTPAYAWPAGAIFEDGWQGPDTRGGQSPAYPTALNLRQLHLNSVNVFTNPIVACNPNNGQTCGEIVLGLVPAAYVAGQPFGQVLEADPFFAPGSSNAVVGGRGILDSGQIEGFCSVGNLGTPFGSIDAYQSVSVDTRGDMNASEFLTAGGNGVPGNNFLTSQYINIGTQFCGGVTREGFSNGVFTTFFYSNKTEQFQANGPFTNSVQGLAIVPQANYPQFTEPALVVQPNVYEGLDIGACGACQNLGSTPSNWSWQANFSPLFGFTWSEPGSGLNGFNLNPDGDFNFRTGNLSGALNVAGTTTLSTTLVNGTITASGGGTSSYAWIAPWFQATGGYYSVPASPPSSNPGTGYDWLFTREESTDAIQLCTRGNGNFGVIPRSGSGGFGTDWCAVMQPLVAVPASASTPVFDFSSQQTYYVEQLTANVTSSTIIWPTDYSKGGSANVLICQNALGGFSFTWPTNVHHVSLVTGNNYTAVVPSAGNTCIEETWVTFDGGANFYAK